MFSHIYTPRPGDQETIKKYIDSFRQEDNAALTLECEQKIKQGIVGVHQQALNLIAFNIVMKERFNNSPIIIEDNCIIRFNENYQAKESLQDAYTHTKYTVFDLPIVIEVNKPCPALSQLLEQYQVTEWSFITAWNPFSKTLTDEENNIRHQALIDLVKEFPHWEGEGIGTDPAWKPERSLLILGIPKEKAIHIGKHFQQNAIVYGLSGGRAELIRLFEY